MKKLYRAIIVLGFISSIVKAQPYNNEWILFSTGSQYSLQPYLKINVWQEGIHRLSYSDITQHFDTANFTPKQLQIFHQGKEQYIFVAGEADGSFDPNDYVEFYGKPNDGSFDTQLYDSAQWHTNPYYSLFNDTAAYFLSINANPFALNKRMIIDNDTNFSNYNAAAYAMKDAFQSYHGYYEDGTHSPYNLDASYTNGEGWAYGSATGDPFGASAPITFSLSSPNVYTGAVPQAPLAYASTIFIGTNAGGLPRNWTLSVNGNIIDNISFPAAFAVNKMENPLPNNSVLLSGTADFMFSPVSANNNERNTITYIKLEYPRTLNFTGESSGIQKFKVPADPALNKTRLDINNFLTGNSPRWLYVFSDDTIRKVNVDFISGTLYQTLVPTFAVDKMCLLTTDASTISTGGFTTTPVSDNPDPYVFSNFNYQNLNNPDYLIIYHRSLKGDAAAYRTFRNSPAGGSYNVLLADIDELYNQFAWGINKNPLSIRNFARLALDAFQPVPKYLFLIGKSIKTGNNPSPRTYPPYYALNLVPTYGDPPSDMMMVSRIHDTIFHPEIAIGRLAARNSTDVQMYLDKVIDHDYQLANPYQEWMKRILHFGGGKTLGEQSSIKQHLETYENIIEDTLYAGNVITFLKTSTDPIQVNLSQYLQNLIDSGVTLMTFFAHAGGSTFDIATDDPANYDNEDRYPVVLANSCFIGDIHIPARQASEDFIFQSNKGAIGFIASPNTGFIPDQFNYGEALYKQIASYSYGEGIGDNMKKCVDSVSLININEAFRKSVRMGMTLHGDPAIRLYPNDKPDLFISPPSVFFTPAEVSTDLPSFKINVVIKNLGKAIDKPYLVRITRKYPPDYTVNPKIFDTVLYNKMPFVDTLVVTIPMDFERASGLNKFDVVVDAGFPDIAEWNENNNSVIDAQLNIKSGDILPVYPVEYSIVPIKDIKLKASTSNIFASAKPYRFEIDTVDRFNSAAKKDAVITSTGGIVQWQLPFSLDSNQVYYWRVANNAILVDTIHFKWNESSFIHIPGKTGWSQAHYSQFKEDEYRNVVYANDAPPIATTFEFVDVATSIKCRNSLYPDEQGGHPVDYFINNEYQGCCGCGAQLNVAVLDSITVEAWTVEGHDLYQFNKWINGTMTGCNNNLSTPNKWFAYHTDSINGNVASLDSMAMALDSLIPQGNYILIYSLYGGKFSHWPSSLKSVMDNLGSSYDFSGGTTLQDWQPYIFFTKKGDTTSTKEVVGDSTIIDIQFDTTIGGNWDKGYITSVLIGPAAQWTQLHWGHYNVEPTPMQDSISLDVIGVESNGTETILIDDLPPAVIDSSLASFSTTTYPFLKLKAYVQDELLQTPPQLDRWQIYYQEVPEGALSPSKHFVHTPLNDTLEQGDTYKFEMAFENISNTNFSDSVLVDFFVYDANNNKINISSPKYEKLNAGDTLVAKVSVNTLNYPGLNSLWIEVNPNNDQPEQYHFNNLASLNFHVNKDITNPILDVTFDGQHILDGDIVSAKPFIIVRLKDENKFLALNDTTKYRVLLTDPEGATKRVYFETAPNQSTDKLKLKWTPAVLPDNSFKIEYNPILLVDGIYVLDVQAYDESWNISGQYSYKISFEVINRSTITEFVNYPNPFSTSTRFVFTLTGSEVPQQLLIQIMTVSGKIVREITQDEIGQLHIGRNITQFAWNGKDQFGDQLANGVYFYRVQTRLNQQSIEHRDTEADKYFKKGFGKMYLMR